MRLHFGNFASASGGDLTTLIVISPKLDSWLDTWLGCNLDTRTGTSNKGTSFNCTLRLQFGNFASASGRDLTTLIGISPKVAQSAGGEILDDWICERSLA